MITIFLIEVGNYVDLLISNMSSFIDVYTDIMPFITNAGGGDDGQTERTRRAVRAGGPPQRGEPPASALCGRSFAVGSTIVVTSAHPQVGWPSVNFVATPSQPPGAERKREKALADAGNSDSNHTGEPPGVLPHVHRAALLLQGRQHPRVGAGERSGPPLQSLRPPQLDGARGVHLPRVRKPCSLTVPQPAGSPWEAVLHPIDSRPQMFW